MKQAAVIFLMVTGMSFFLSAEAVAQVKDAVKEIIMNKKVQSTAVKAAEKKMQAQDTAKKKTAEMPAGTSKETVSPKPAGFAIDDAGVPNDKKDNAPNEKKGILPVKPAPAPSPSGGASNFAIDDPGVPNEKNATTHKPAGTTIPKTGVAPKVKDSIPK